jgi:hypothetical protein
MLHFGAPAEVAKMESVQPMVAATPRGSEILSLIQQRQRIMKDAWLTETGHQRPGMKKGLPLAEAQVQAAELDARLRAALQALPGVGGIDAPTPRRK